MTPEYWTQATEHLSRQCPTMAGLIARYEGESLRARGDAFYTLIRAVAGQQISVKAADSIWARLEKTVKPLTPNKLLATPDEKLRACGFSNSKVAYARNVAQFFVERGISLSSPLEGEPNCHFSNLVGGRTTAHASPPTSPRGRRLPLKGGVKKEPDYWTKLSDEEVIAQLTSIKGIGTWTAEMFLIFHLMRPNVFPLKDLGVLKAINIHYVKPAQLKNKKWLSASEYEKIAVRWAPYRTVATWYLWRALDPVPVAY